MAEVYKLRSSEMNYDMSNQWCTQTIIQNVRRLITDVENVQDILLGKKSYKTNPILLKLYVNIAVGIYPKL